MDPASLPLFAKAAGIGLILAVPLGPIGLLCLRRSLTHGMAAGLVTGMGAATADGVYAGLAAFGLAAVAPLLEQADWLPALGGVALIGLGLWDILHRPAPAQPATLTGHIGAYAGTVLLTLSNPATILTFAAIIVGLDLLPAMGALADRALFVLGMFLGSALWWMVLSALGGVVGDRMPAAAVAWTRRAAGVAFVAFGLYALLS